MAIKYLSDIDLGNLQLVRARVENRSNNPTVPTGEENDYKGYVYYNTADNSFYYFNGTSWVKLTQVNVASVNNLTGAITLTTNEVPEGSNNKYYVKETAQDDVAQMFTAATHRGLSVNYNDSANTLSVDLTQNVTLTFPYQVFTGSLNQTTFIMNEEVLSPTHLLVSVGGVLQTPFDSYTINGYQLVFSEAPEEEAKITVRYMAAPVVITDTVQLVDGGTF